MLMYVFCLSYDMCMNKCISSLSRFTTQHSWSWRSPSIYGNGPPGRSYHSATVLGNGHQVVYFGGNDGDRCYNKVHVLQVGIVVGLKVFA